MMPSLMIDHLSINLRSGTDNLVSEISFAIKEGESLILLGQSGSGKTMTCSAVLNLLDPKKFKVSGSVFFGETDLLNSSEKQRRGIYGNQIVYIPQNPMTALDPSMRIGRQMDETLRLHSDKSRQQRYNYILRLLHDVGLDDPDRVYRAYTFHLRDGVKFSDGTPLTSEAVKMTLEAVVTHLGPQNGAFGKLTTLFDKLETPDEKTFVMTLKTPYYAALDNLTMALPLGIVNPAAFEGGVEKAYENCVSATMGTGPYMFDRVEGDTYTFIRNPYYWGEAPEVDEFKVKVIPDNAAKILALRNGEIDAILGSSRLSAEGYTEISQDAAFGHAMDDSTNQTRYLGMNLNKAPFNDPLVREAVSYAVNQQELETSVFDGLETAAETLFTNEKPNCGVEVKTYPTDMEKAKQLMKEAGYEDTNDDGILEKDGTSLAIHFNYSQSLASVDNAVLSIAASLKELGFDVTIDAVDMNTWYGALMAGEYDLTFYNTAGGSFDPATDMSNMAPGAMGDPILCQFSAFFENPEIFAELDSTSDSQRVQEIYGMILNGIADQNLLVPVTGTHDLALWNTDKITGYDFYTDASYVDIASVHVK